MSTSRRIALAALLIATGNIASRIIGFVREGVIAASFARGPEVDVFTAASALTTILYDLLISGAIGAALVPVFSEYAEQDEHGLWRVFSSVLNLALLMTASLAALLAWQAPLMIAIVAGGFEPALQSQATSMLRWLLPSVVAMALAGLITALLQARQRFLLPAFTTSAYNLGIILGVVLLAPMLGAFSLVIGVIAGALLQVALQLPGLRGLAYQPVIDLRHPGVRRILLLYAPVALGIGFSILGMVLDRNLASWIGNHALSTMRYATTLIQLPLGLVAAAVSFAVLPTLARQTGRDEAAFSQTLAMGLKVVLLLIIPATALLAALAFPVVQLLFERYKFTSNDTQVVARALHLYLPGLPAAALDQVLLFAVYARRKTLMPNLVQGAAVGLYALTALGLLNFTSLRVEALVLGNSVQWIGHLLILALFARSLFSLSGQRLGEAVLKSTIAGLLAFAVALVCAGWLSWAGPLVQVLGGGLAGGAAYLGLCVVLRVEALDQFVRLIQASPRLRRR